MSLLISIFSFFLVSQLGYHFNLLSSTVLGYKVDYLIPTVYLTDLLALSVLFFGRKELKSIWRLRNLGYLVLIFVFIFINISRTGFAIYSIYKWLRVIVLFLVGVVLIKSKKYDFFNNFIKPLSYSVFVVNILAIFQYFNKGSIGGIFPFLGERNFRFTDPNISPYPYSTFSHPNSLAGFLSVFLFFILIYKNKLNRTLFLLTTVMVVVVILLSGSLSAIISTLFVLALFFISKRKKTYDTSKLPMLVLLTERSIPHRLELITASLKMAIDNLFFGVGLNNFIEKYPSYSVKFLSLWELQPVHNIFLLVLSETGLLGLSSFLYLCYLVLMEAANFPFIVVLATGMFDHYWLTLEQNLYLLLFVVVFSLRKESAKL